MNKYYQNVIKLVDMGTLKGFIQLFIIYVVSSRYVINIRRVGF